MNTSVNGISAEVPDGAKKAWSPPVITDARVVSSTESGTFSGTEGAPTGSLGLAFYKTGS
jgi:hypothetical protein